MKAFNPLVGSIPTSLSSATCNLAADYLSGVHHARLQPADFSWSDLPGGATLSRQLLLGKLARLTAERAPLGIVDGERLAGSAPLLDAMEHRIPGTQFSSISHTTVDFGDAVRLGLSGLEQELLATCDRAKNSAERKFCSSLLEVIEAMRLWTRRYREAFRTTHCRNAFAAELADRLERVPEYPPENFADALQSFWSFFEFQRLNGNWSGLGRFDEILGPYLENDLQAGRITRDEARERIAHFWIKGTEWCHGLAATTPFAPGSGDAQSYQNIVLGGTAANGTQVENTVTHLVLEVIAELHISDYPVAVRLNNQSSERLLRHVAELQLDGGGIVSVYNEPIVMAALRRFGYPEEEVVAFTNDGCWEVLIPGKTFFGYCPFDALQIFQEAFDAVPPEASFEDIFNAYSARMRDACAERVTHVREMVPHDEDAVLSLLMPCCRRAGKGYETGGACYTVKALHPGGLPDVANSLAAIQFAVFDRKLLSLEELKTALQCNWQNAEALRRKIHALSPCYGNHDATADALMRRVIDDFAATMEEFHEHDGVLCPAGVSTFGREIAYAEHRKATAFGAFAGACLAPNLSPTPGTERQSVLEVLSSYGSLELSRIPNGAPLDLRLDAAIRRHPEAVHLQMALLKTFLQQSGFYLQIDVVDPAMLRQAQLEPDRFPNLVVRISGWSARFATLERTWQDMLIQRLALDFAP